MRAAGRAQRQEPSLGPKGAAYKAPISRGRPRRGRAGAGLRACGESREVALTYREAGELAPGRRATEDGGVSSSSKQDGITHFHSCFSPDHDEFHVIPYLIKNLFLRLRVYEGRKGYFRVIQRTKTDHKTEKKNETELGKNQYPLILQSPFFTLEGKVTPRGQ